MGNGPVGAERPKTKYTDRRGWRIHLSFIYAALACILVFGWMLTFGTGRVFEADSLGGFYDYQAQSLLHGHWDVPEPALGGEAFVVNGKHYGYFGPTPALLRAPLIALGIGFGRLTRLMMLLDYAACLIATYLLMRDAARRVGPKPIGRWLSVFFTLSVGLGSTLFYLSSRAYVYHEAIFCGAAFALWSCWCTLRYFEQPASRWWIGGLICGILAVQARPPTGLFALTCLGIAAAWHLVRSLGARRTTGRPAGRANTTDRDLAGPSGGRDARYGRHLVIGLISVLGVFTFNAVAYAKFGTFDGCPLKYHVQYTPQRLAAIDGGNFHLSNLRFNFDSYAWRSKVKLNRHFPYLTLDYLNRLKDYPESKIDYRDPTLALPYAMPALVFLAVVAVAITLVRQTPARPTVVLLCVSALPFTLAMLMAIAVTQRYTVDFCPFFIALAAIGVSQIDGLPSRLKIGYVAVLVTLVAIGSAVEVAITLHTQRAVVWGVPVDVQQQYRTWQHRIDTWFGVDAKSVNPPTPHQ